MPISSIAIGTPAEASSPDALKAALAEFISMLIFVFAGEGAGMAFGKTIVFLLVLNNKCVYRVQFWDPQKYQKTCLIEF